MRIARQTSLFELLLWRNIRQVSHIQVLRDRAHHRHHVRPAEGVLILPWLLRKGGRAPIHAKPNQGEKDRAKNKTEENAWIKETGSGRALFFHKGFFLSVFWIGQQTRFLFEKLSDWPNAEPRAKRRRSGVFLHRS